MATLTHKFWYLSFVLILILVIDQSRLTNQESLTDNVPKHMSDEGSEKRSSNSYGISNDQEESARHTDYLQKNVPYFQASLPMRVYECLRDFSALRCTKLFMLQKMEESRNMVHTGNLTRDFLAQFFDSDDKLDSLINNKYSNMSDEKLNQCLILKFQKFFKNRDIKLNFLPGITMKIVPSRNNKLSFILKKGTTTTNSTENDVASSRSSKHVEEIDETLIDADLNENQNDEQAITKQSELGLSGIEFGGVGHGGGGGGGGDKHGAGGGGVGGHGGGGGHGGNRRKNKKGSSYSSYKSTILQMAVPVMVMPAVLMGTILPFLLPVLKMATFMSIILNNSAFIASLIYAARTHANAQEEQHISYPPQGSFY